MLYHIGCVPNQCPSFSSWPADLPDLPAVIEYYRQKRHREGVELEQWEDCPELNQHRETLLVYCHGCGRERGRVLEVLGLLDSIELKWSHNETRARKRRRSFDDVGGAPERRANFGREK